MRIAAVRDTLNSLPGSGVIKMPEAEIAKAVNGSGVVSALCADGAVRFLAIWASSQVLTAAVARSCST